MKTMRLRLGLSFGLFAAFLLASASGLAHGQAVVNGAVVFGNSSKPVPGVTVHLVNKNVHPTVDVVTKTGDDGSYTFDNVVPGMGYAVAVYDATGKVVGTDPSFSVSANDPLHTAVPDIDISRGLTAERAAKSGGVIQLDYGISPGANVSNEQVRVLPLFNRNFLNLGLIQPGVHDVPQGSALQGAGFSIAGSPATSTYFLLDGVDNVASNNNQAIPFQINEAVREFRVTYATPDLRYGQGSGGIVDVITSSGDFGTAGHSFHGSLFGYFNTDALNAGTPLSAYANTGFARSAAFANVTSSAAASVIYIDPAYNPSASGATPPSNCNAVSGTAQYCGYSPQSYNALFNLLSPGSSVNVLPSGSGCNTALCAAGMFTPSGILSSQDSHTQPFTSKQFGGSIGGPFGRRAFLFGSYEATLIDNPTPTFERVPTFLDRTQLATLGAGAGSDQGIAQGVLGLFPQPNVGQTGSALIANSGSGIFGFYRGYAPNYTHVHGVQFRPDISLGGLGSISLRYTGQLLDQLHDDTLPASSAYPGNGANRKAQNQSAALSYNYQFGQSRNILGIAFTQYRVDEVAQDRGFNTSGIGLAAGAMPSVILSGIDPQTTAPGSNTTALPRTQGYVGGWYDSFWQTCAAGGGISVCGSPGSLVQSAAPITPSLDGDFPFARLGAPLSAPSKRRDTEAFLSDVLSLHLGARNNLDIGGDYRYQQNFSYDGGIARGLVVSNNIGEFTHDAETCVSCTPRSAFTHPSFDYELRQPVGYTGDLRSNVFGFFAQDQFRPLSKLTVVAGVRYDYFGQQLDTLNRQWNYSFANQGLNRQGQTGTFDAFDYQCGGGATFFDAVYGPLRASTPANGTLCTPGSFQLPTDKKNIGALVGISYAPGAKTVIRAAGGAYYDHAPASYNQKLLLNRPSPFNVANPSAIYGQNFASPYASTQCQQYTQCSFGLSTLNFQNYAAGTTGAATFQNFQAASGANVLYARDVNELETPYLMQFSGSIQRRFSGSWSGELGYVGSMGNRLPLVYDGNFTTEFYCQSNGVCSNNTYFPVFTQSNIGSSSYNSLVARVQANLYHGLSMHASYTYSKSLDNVVSSDFPNATDSLFSQLYGRQLYGLGNPAVFALQQSAAGYGSNGGLRGSQLGSQNARTAVLQSANIPSFTSVQSALTTTGSRAINTSSYNLPQNPLAFSSAGAAPGADYGPSDFDVRHRAVADFVYNVPFKNAFARGFTISGITTVQSGQPFTIFSGPAYGQVTQRVNVSSASPIRMTGDPNGYITGVTRANLPSLNSSTCPTLYAQPSLYKFGATQGACIGNSGRNAFTGPAYFSQDAAVQRGIHFTERKTLVLRAEIYNVFNRANYYNPISEVSADGVHPNPEFGLIRSAHDPRQVQFAARFDF